MEAKKAGIITIVPHKEGGIDMNERANKRDDKNKNERERIYTQANIYR